MGHNGHILQTLVFAAENLDVDDLDDVQAFTGDIGAMRGGWRCGGSGR